MSTVEINCQKKSKKKKFLAILHNVPPYAKLATEWRWYNCERQRAHRRHGGANLGAAYAGIIRYLNKKA